MRRSVFLAVACAGCATYLSVDEAAGRADVTGERIRRIPWSTKGRAGTAISGMFFRHEEHRDAFEDGLYFDLRYRYEFTPQLGVEATVGLFRSESKEMLVGGFPFQFDDIECVPVRLTVTFGGESKTAPIRWFVGGGGGYLIYGDEHSAPPERPLDNEWATHVLLGLEIRPAAHFEFPICTRIDAGYLWTGESELDGKGVDLMMLGFSFYFGF